MSSPYTAYKTAADLNECLVSTKFHVAIVETGKSVQYKILHNNCSEYNSSALFDILSQLKLLMGTIQFAECFDKTRVNATERAS